MRQVYRFGSARGPVYTDPVVPEEIIPVQPCLSGDGVLSGGGLERTIRKAREWLLARQRPDGHWVGELEGGTILETEYVLLQQFLGSPDRSRMRKLCQYVVHHWQNQDGGFPIYPGGSSDISVSVEAYFACKLAGFSADEPFMIRLRNAILRHGGATKCNTFTKLYLAVFGQYDWDGVPTIPPELILLPSWLYINIYEMSSWSRAILVPLAIVNAMRPSCPVPPECNIDELFIGGRHGDHLRLPYDKRLVSWRNAFLLADRVLKLYARKPFGPLRALSIKVCERWLRDRQKNTDGLAAIFPGIVHAVMAYKSLGYANDHPAVKHELSELEKLVIEEDGEMRVQPCVSPVWDTAIAICALVESGLPNDHPAIRKAANWLVERQVHVRGDWATKVPGVEPGGWVFEYQNELYPDVDDSGMVLLALHKAYCRNGEPWQNAPPKAREAMRKGLAWVLAMQCRNGGWSAYDKDNDKRILECVPYADHNAMIDPATVDVTARVLEMLGLYGFSRSDAPVRRAMDYIHAEQERDGSWFGRWGVNYIYGTWQTLCGLANVEDSVSERRLRGAGWIRSVQNSDGGWGETCRSYEDPGQKGVGPSTPSQTAWASLGLMAANDPGTPELRHGVQHLIRTQRPDGTWDEPWFTGTGFPKVFYIRYHLYRHSFPLWALGRYARERRGAEVAGK